MPVRSREGLSGLLARALCLATAAWAGPALGADEAAGAAGGATPAAATPAAVVASTDIGASDLGEIVVHARRRDERLVDAPVAITVETGEQLQEQDEVLFKDVARGVPNLHMMQSPRSTSALEVTMRGQTAISSAIVYDPAVGIYVDGVYVANGQAAMGTLLDIDTVEVARGVQGTLFGRNNTGGAISFTTHRPELGSYGGEVSLGAGDYQAQMARGILNAPLSDTLALRLAFQDNERQGYGSSNASGQNNFNNQNRWQSRMGLLWKPGAGFDAFLSYEHFQAREGGALLHPLHGTGIEQLSQSLPLAQFGLPVVNIPDNIYQTNGAMPSYDNTNLDATQLTLTQALDPGTRAKLILGYRRLSNQTALDVDATALPFADSTLSNASSQKSAEFQLGGKTLANRLDWVAGLYWFRDDGNAPSVVAAQSPDYQGAVGALNNFLQMNYGYPAGSSVLPLVPFTIYERNSVQNLSTAAFAHAEYHLSDRWAAAVGLRRTDDTRKLAESSFADTPGGPVCTIPVSPTDPTPAGNGGPCPPINEQVKYAYWSWELSTRYRVSDELNTYLRSGRGQRSGGWNAPVNSLQDQPFKPETLTDYELGFKADLLGGGLLVDGDVFYGRYDQMQRLLPQLVGGTPTTYVINAGRARISGAELEANLRSSRSLSFQGSLGLTNAKYLDFSYNYLPPQGPPIAVNLANNDFYQTPRLTASAGATYELRLASGTLSLHADYAWQDKIQFNLINDFNQQAAYGTLNARATLAADSRSWALAVFGTNLTNRQYAVAGGSVGADPTGQTPPPISWQIPGDPRMYGLELTYRFGGKS